jgi:D-glycero-D-manno-heptose 1,7-bisphosphate phosphatase
MTPAASPAGRPALFLDRDGVINVNHGYVHKAEDTQFIPGIFALVARAHAAGRAVVVVTNQAGIGRGYYTEAQFDAYTAWMQAEFAARGAPIERVYFCPDHPEHGIGRYRRETQMRKPGPGMLLQAAAELQLDLGRSMLVGDAESDIQAGRSAGLGCTVRFHPEGGPLPDTQADAVVHSLDAIDVALP